MHFICSHFLPPLAPDSVFTTSKKTNLCLSLGGRLHGMQQISIALKSLSEHKVVTKSSFRRGQGVRRGLPTDIAVASKNSLMHGKNTQFKCSHICPRLCTDLCPLKHNTFWNQSVHLDYVCSPASTLQSSPMLPEVDDIDCNGSTCISLNRSSIAFLVSDFPAMSEGTLIKSS